MLGEVWYDTFLKTLSDKYSKRGQLTDALMGLLHIEREAVYRRLRKDVLFTVPEIAKIATTWNISLDDILGLHSKKKRFDLQLMDYLTPSDEDLRALQTMVQHFEKFKDIPDFEYMEIGNKLPRMLLVSFPLVNRLSLLRWVYYAGTSSLPLSQVFYSDAVSKCSVAYYHAVKNLPQVNFIVDAKALKYLVEDIIYFHSISLISDEEKESLKKEMHTIIDYGSEIAGKGCWPETGHKVNLYISQLNIDTNYNYYYYNGEAQSCSIQVFGRSEIYSDDKEIIDKVRMMVQRKKQSSILISGVNEQNRTVYFNEQRKILDSL